MPTEYIILRSVNDNGWIQEKTIAAVSARSAIRQFLSNYNGDAYTYVAVPARSWQPVTVTVETKTQLKFQ